MGVLKNGKNGVYKSALKQGGGAFMRGAGLFRSNLTVLRLKLIGRKNLIPKIYQSANQFVNQLVTPSFGESALRSNGC